AQPALHRAAHPADRPRVRGPPAVRGDRRPLRRPDAPAAGGLLLRPGGRGAQPRADDGPLPARQRRLPGLPGPARAAVALRRHRRAGGDGARAGAPRDRADRRARAHGPRGRRLPGRAVPRVVPQGADGGGGVRVGPARRRAPRRREPAVGGGAPRARGAPRRHGHHRATRRGRGAV
ncbi:MAG: Ferritin, partial [uncultured Solirubrobacteraceae bacterium]